MNLSSKTIQITSSHEKQMAFQPDEVETSLLLLCYQTWPPLAAHKLLLDITLSIFMGIQSIWPANMRAPQTDCMHTYVHTYSMHDNNYTRQYIYIYTMNKYNMHTKLVRLYKINDFMI